MSHGFQLEASWSSLSPSQEKLPSLPRRKASRRLDLRFLPQQDQKEYSKTYRGNCMIGMSCWGQITRYTKVIREGQGSEGCYCWELAWYAVGSLWWVEGPSWEWGEIMDWLVVSFLLFTSMVIWTSLMGTRNHPDLHGARGRKNITSSMNHMCSLAVLKRWIRTIQFFSDRFAMFWSYVCKPKNQRPVAGTLQRSLLWGKMAEKVLFRPDSPDVCGLWHLALGFCTPGLAAVVAPITWNKRPTLQQQVTCPDGFVQKNSFNLSSDLPKSS